MTHPLSKFPVSLQRIEKRLPWFAQDRGCPPSLVFVVVDQSQWPPWGCHLCVWIWWRRYCHSHILGYEAVSQVTTLFCHHWLIQNVQCRSGHTCSQCCTCPVYTILSHALCAERNWKTSLAGGQQRVHKPCMFYSNHGNIYCILWHHIWQKYFLKFKCRFFFMGTLIIYYL